MVNGLLRSVLLGGVLLSVAATPFLPQTAVSATGINEQINFQGKVVNTDGTNVADGNYDMVFKLYDASSSGTNLWTETRTGGSQVNITNGIFQVNLGSICPLTSANACNTGPIDFNSDSIYLTMNFNSNGEMSPRIRFTAVPYAFNAQKLGGIDKSGFVQLAPSAAQTNSGSNSSIFINNTSSGNLLQLQSGSTDKFLISSSGVTTINNNSTTGLKVEQTGVHSNVLVVDTTNGSVGINTAPNTSGSILQITGAVQAVQSSSTAWASGLEGSLVYDDTANKFYAYDNTAKREFGTLQGAYDWGNTLTTTNARNIAITFADTATDQSLTLTQQGTATALILNDTNAATDTAIDVQSGGISKLTVTELGTLSTSGNISTTGSGTITSAGILNANATGKTAITIADSGAQSSGITVGGDTNLYRGVANGLRTDDQLQLSNSSTSCTAYATGGAESCVWFGNDTNLYRSGGGALKTDGSFYALGNIQTNSDIAARYPSGPTIVMGIQGPGGTAGLALAVSGSATDVVLYHGAAAGSIGVQATGSNPSNFFVKATSSQSTTDLFQLQDSSGNALAKFTSNGDLTVGGTSSSSSTAALKVQNTSAQSLFAVDTTNRLVTLNDGQAANGNSLILDSSSAAPTGSAAVNGAMYYDTGTNKFRCYQNGGFTDCIAAGGSTSLQNAYDNSTSPATILLSATDDNILFQNPASGGTDIAGAPVLKVENLATGNVEGLRVESAGTGNLLTVRDTTATAQDVLTIADGGATTFRNQTNSTAAFQIQNAGGTSVLAADTSNSIVRPGVTASFSSISRTNTTVDSTDDIGSYSSIAISTDGLPVISYYDSTNGNLRVTKCGNAACSSGNTTTAVDSTNDVGKYSSITIGTDGLPVISYYDDGTNHDLRVTKCGNAACSSGNTSTTVDSTNDVGQHSSIAIATDGLPVISYYNVTSGDLRVTKCGNAACSSGNTSTTVDSTNDVGKYSSITIGTDGLPVISHLNTTSFDLRVTKCGNTACSSGNTSTTVDSTGIVGLYSSITIGTDGLPIVSDDDSGNGDLRVTKCGNAACSSGNTSNAISSLPEDGNFSSIAIGTDGLPVISHQNIGGGGKLRVTKCANASCSASSGSSFGGGITLGTISAGFQSVYFDTLNLGRENSHLQLNEQGNFITNGLTAFNDGSVRIEADSANALRVQDAEGHDGLVYDTTNGHLKIFEDTTTPTNYLDLYYDNATSTAVIAASSGTTKVGNGTGPININAGSGAAVTITGHAASTWSTDAGALTLTGAAASTWSTSAGNLTLQAGSGTVSLGSSTALTANGALTLSSGGSSGLTFVSASGITTITDGTNNSLIFDTSGNHLKLFADIASPTNYLDMYYDNATSTAIIAASSGTTQIGSSGPITIDPGSSDSVTITGRAASTWSTTSGALTITSAAAATWSTSSGQQLTVQSGSGNLSLGSTTTLSATGALTVTPGGALTLNTSSNGDLTLTPDGTGDVALNLDDGTGLILGNAGGNATVTNTGSLEDINLILGADADVDTVSALNIDVTSANTGDADVLNGIYLGVGSTDSTVKEYGLHIGSGWDAGIVLDDTTPTIRLNATDNTGILSIQDSSSNTLLRLQDNATNFGASIEAGAFIDYNETYTASFFKTGTQQIADATAGGDDSQWSFNETGTCLGDRTVDVLNGIYKLTANATASACSSQFTDTGALATPSLSWNATNLPTIVMKVRAGVAGAGVPDTDHQFFAGLANATGDATPVSGSATMHGIYFTNASDGSGVTGTANWYAVTDNGSGASVTATNCNVAIDESNYALLVIKVMSTSLVKYYVDANVADGISLTECGTGNTTNIDTTGMTGFFKADWDANSNASTLEIDYFKAWQDDAPNTANSSSTDSSTQGGEPLAVDSAPSTFDSRQALTDLTISSENTEYDPSQRLDTQVLYASKGVVTPELTTDKVLANSIEAATGTDISMKLSDDGRFVITNPAGEEAVAFDSLGNAKFAGTITADKIKANQIEGLEVFTDKISSLQAKLASESSSQTSSSTTTGASQPAPSDLVINQATVALDLKVNGSLTVLNGLTVSGDAEFNGDTLFDKLVTFGDNVDFKKDVSFEGQATFNNDVGGQVVIHKGAKKAEITFKQPYPQTPIVNASWIFDDTKDKDGKVTDSAEAKQQRMLSGGFSFALTKVSEKGFTITLNKPAEEDLFLNWTALPVKDAKQTEGNPN